MRVLIIEDDPASRDLAKRIVEGLGHSVLTADAGREGLRLAHSERPDLIVLDLHLPDLPGWVVARQLREAALFHATPIIAVSAGTTEDRDRAMDAGCSAFVPKPFDLTRFRTEIESQYSLVQGS